MTPIQTVTIPTALDLECQMFQRIKDGESSNERLLWQANHTGLVAPNSSRRILEQHPGDQAVKWPLYFRMTGGDVTPQGPGILNLSLAYRVQEHCSIADVYVQFCAQIQSALDQIGVKTCLGPVRGSYCDGSYNIIIDGRKFAGTAQRLSKPQGGNGHGSVFIHALMTIATPAYDGVSQINALYAKAGIRKTLDPATTISLDEVTTRTPDFLTCLQEFSVSRKADSNQIEMS